MLQPMKNNSAFNRIAAFVATFVLFISCSVEKSGQGEEELIYNDSHTLIIYMMGNNGLATFMDSNFSGYFPDCGFRLLFLGKAFPCIDCLVSRIPQRS